MADYVFEFGKYTEVTDLAFNVNSEYVKNGYTRIFLCENTFVTWLVRILPGFNDEYEKDENKIVIERERIENDFKHQKLTYRRAVEILKNDTFGNWDCRDSDNLELLILIIDGGFGINNLITENNQ